MRTNTGIFKSLNLNVTDAEFQNAGFHNSIYREKNITSYLSDGSLWTRISSGKFDDLFIGDYFNVDFNGKSTLFRLACFDMFYYTGLSSTIYDHHVVIIPDDSLVSAAMGKSDNSLNGYDYSTMRRTTIPTLVQHLETALGASHIIETNESLTSHVDQNAKNCLRPNLTGASSSCSTEFIKANLLSEVEVFGCMSYSSSGYETNYPHYGQLPLFRLNPRRRVASSSAYWLRTIASYNNYCYVKSRGSINYDSYSTEKGVRPRFVIG